MTVIVRVVEKLKKRDTVLDVFEAHGAANTVIIVEKRQRADFLASYLSESNYKTTSTHGARDRGQRIHALFEYNTGQMESIVMSRVNITFSKKNYSYD